MTKATPAPPTRVLFILPSLGQGGAETQTIDLLSGLPIETFQKHLLCFEPGSHLRARLDGANVDFSYVPRSRKFDPAVARAIAGKIDRERIDIVHCSLMISLFWGWLGILLSKRKPALITAVHTTVNVTPRAEVFDWILYRWLMRCCQRVIFVCDAQRAHWCAKFPELATRAVVIHNGINVEDFHKAQVRSEADALRQSLDLPEGRVIAHIAGFRIEKGHAILLEAFALLRKVCQDVYLVFAGDGNLRSEIERRAHELGVTASVRFLGVVADVRPLLAITHCSVVPSLAETFSMAVLESMAMEVPVVATDVGGMCEAVLPGITGYLVPPKDPVALAEGLLKCLGNEGERVAMGRNGRALVAERFRRELMIIRTGELLQNVPHGSGS